MGFKETAKKLIPQKLLLKRALILYRHRVNTVLKKRVIKPYNPSLFPEGVNLIGPFKAQIGLGQSCRLLANAIKESSFDYTFENFDLIGTVQNGDSTFDDEFVKETPYGINIIHMEPTELMLRCVEFDENLWNERYNIAFWLWELEEFPNEWTPAINLVDEIWTPSEFASESVRKVTDKPVVTIPYNVTAETEAKYDRKYFNLPEDKFLFLVMFDANSTMMRKNPLGAIEAYKKAFSPDDDSVGIVIKTNNAKEKKLEPVKQLLEGYKNVYFITDILEKKAVNSLIADVDVFVSLHRAEGFGLVMAEAMLNGTVCIATNWSSNTEFMNKDVACMVDYSFITLEKDMSPYRKGAKWADANTDEAAGYMKRLSTDKVFYDDLSKKAKAYIKDKLSMDSVKNLLEKRINEIKSPNANI